LTHGDEEKTEAKRAKFEAELARGKESSKIREARGEECPNIQRQR
jgi:hypothetical protein